MPLLLLLPLPRTKNTKINQQENLQNSRQSLFHRVKCSSLFADPGEQLFLYWFDTKTLKPGYPWLCCRWRAKRMTKRRHAAHKMKRNKKRVVSHALATTAPSCCLFEAQWICAPLWVVDPYRPVDRPRDHLAEIAGRARTSTPLSHFTYLCLSLFPCC